MLTEWLSMCNLLKLHDNCCHSYNNLSMADFCILLAAHHCVSRLKHLISFWTLPAVSRDPKQTQQTGIWPTVDAAVPYWHIAPQIINKQSKLRRPRGLKYVFQFRTDCVALMPTLDVIAHRFLIYQICTSLEIKAAIVPILYEQRNRAIITHRPRLILQRSKCFRFSLLCTLIY